MSSPPTPHSLPPLPSPPSGILGEEDRRKGQWQALCHEGSQESFLERSAREDLLYVMWLSFHHMILSCDGLNRDCCMGSHVTSVCCYGSHVTSVCCYEESCDFSVLLWSHVTSVCCYGESCDFYLCSSGQGSYKNGARYISRDETPLHCHSRVR